ncbi:MAG: glycosyltransferase family 4 protein [Planctomycetota bacterium]
MKIVLVAAGAGGMYCGSCLRENALALELRALGHEVLVAPVYTPLRTDEDSAAEGRVFLGAVEVYLEEKLPGLFGRRGLLRRLASSQALLRAVSRFALGASARDLGRLTVSALRGPDGRAKTSVEDLVSWVAGTARPDVVHLSNALLSGIAPPLRRAGFRVACGLEGEDLFLDSLPAEYRERAIALVRANAGSVDRFLAASAAYADRAAALFSIELGRIDVVRTGIRTRDYEAPPERREDRPPAVGYFARIAPEKGLAVLAEAFAILARSGSFPDLRLRVAGYLGGANVRHAARIRRWLASQGLARRVEILGTLERREKIEFLRSLDVFSVPSVVPEAKGIFVLEALACGVPVVEPAHGAFVELVEATGGGLLAEPGSARDLAEKLAKLLADPALRRELGERGRAAVLERFSARRMAEETSESYRRAAASALARSSAEGTT